MLRAASCALVLLLAAPAAAVNVPAELPAPVCSAIESCRMVGKGRLRWWGFHVYDAALWSRDGRWQPDAPYVLDIVYARRISGAQLAATSIDEMRRMGATDEARLARWEAGMRTVFPDVEAGSRLIGLYLPGRGAQFHSGTRPLGSIEDPEFARRFFEIWLDPRTQTPDLRTALLGGDGRAR
ncbi:MAG: chalcone isomerase family protein [Burkholderiales bacterium]|nr:chalcone isomerase family protein [Burkholderiales bacterium]